MTSSNTRFTLFHGRGTTSSSLGAVEGGTDLILLERKMMKEWCSRLTYLFLLGVGVGISPPSFSMSLLSSEMTKSAVKGNFRQEEHNNNGNVRINVH